ncbi:hypothetical protein [Kitasatospora acidiphila]|uniref:hypothetical protein n=1 Tax=Kitasatospora acidiphila TaxID=2567942 RepID=UPI003C706BC0
MAFLCGLWWQDTHGSRWLAREHTAARGCYVDPVVRESSALCRVITEHAQRRFECPDTCAGTAKACDGCDACAEDDHRHPRAERRTHRQFPISRP